METITAYYITETHISAFAKRRRQCQLSVYPMHTHSTTIRAFSSTWRADQHIHTRTHTHTHTHAQSPAGLQHLNNTNCYFDSCASKPNWVYVNSEKNELTPSKASIWNSVSLYSSGLQTLRKNALRIMKELQVGFDPDLCGFRFVTVRSFWNLCHEQVARKRTHSYYHILCGCIFFNLFLQDIPFCSPHSHQCNRIKHQTKTCKLKEKVLWNHDSHTSTMHNFRDQPRDYTLQKPTTWLFVHTSRRRKYEQSIEGQLQPPQVRQPRTATAAAYKTAAAATNETKELPHPLKRKRWRCSCRLCLLLLFLF